MEGRVCTFRVRESDRIRTVKIDVEAETGWPAEQQRVLYGGKELGDQEQVVAGTTLTVLLRLRGGAGRKPESSREEEASREEMRLSPEEVMARLREALAGPMAGQPSGKVEYVANKLREKARERVKEAVSRPKMQRGMAIGMLLGELKIELQPDESGREDKEEGHKQRSQQEPRKGRGKGQQTEQRGLLRDEDWALPVKLSPEELLKSEKGVTLATNRREVEIFLENWIEGQAKAVVSKSRWNITGFESETVVAPVLDGVTKMPRRELLHVYGQAGARKMDEEGILGVKPRCGSTSVLTVRLDARWAEEKEWWRAEKLGTPWFRQALSKLQQAADLPQSGLDIWGMVREESYVRMKARIHAAHREPLLARSGVTIPGLFIWAASESDREADGWEKRDATRVIWTASGNSPDAQMTQAREWMTHLSLLGIQTAGMVPNARGLGVRLPAEVMTRATEELRAKNPQEEMVVSKTYYTITGVPSILQQDEVLALLQEEPFCWQEVSAERPVYEGGGKGGTVSWTLSTCTSEGAKGPKTLIGPCAMVVEKEEGRGWTGKGQGKGKGKGMERESKGKGWGKGKEGKEEKAERRTWEGFRPEFQPVSFGRAFQPQRWSEEAGEGAGDRPAEAAADVTMEGGHKEQTEDKENGEATTDLSKRGRSAAEFIQKEVEKHMAALRKEVDDKITTVKESVEEVKAQGGAQQAELSNITAMLQVLVSRGQGAGESEDKGRTQVKAEEKTPVRATGPTQEGDERDPIELTSPLPLAAEGADTEMQSQLGVVVATNSNASKRGVETGASPGAKRQ